MEAIRDWFLGVGWAEGWAVALLAIALFGCAAPLPEPPDLSDRLAPYQEGPTTESKNSE